jgi:siroheme synthase (precorrin-2 oxidase/ferrochelatase)
MRLTIDIPPDMERRLNQSAAVQGVDAAEYVRRLIDAHLPPPDGDDATLALLAQWDAEDETDDPQELERRRRDWEEFKQSINANHPSNRRIYP